MVPELVISEPVQGSSVVGNLLLGWGLSREERVIRPQILSS